MQRIIDAFLRIRHWMDEHRLPEGAEIHLVMPDKPSEILARHALLWSVPIWFQPDLHTREDRAPLIAGLRFKITSKNKEA